MPNPTENPRTPHVPSDEPSWEFAPQPRPGGVRRLAIVGLCLGIAAGMTYVVPGLEALRPLRKGQPVPFASLLQLREPWTDRYPDLGGVRDRDDVVTSDDELLAIAPLPVRGPFPSTSPQTGNLPANQALRIAPHHFAGMTQVIEDPTEGMFHFYRRLRETAAGRRDALTRVLVYSDSINAADRVTSAVRQRLQGIFGDGGKGFVPIAPGWPYQRHQDVLWNQQGGFRTSVVNRGEDALAHYGLGGVLATNRSRFSRATFATVSTGTVGTRVGRFRLFYQAHPEGGDVELSVDGVPRHAITTHAAGVEDHVHDLDVEDGQHELAVRVKDGRVRLYGVVMERKVPGVVIDGLMLIGAFTRVLLHFDAQHWQRQIQLRRPDLMVFWLGGNDAISRSVPFQRRRFEEDYVTAIHRARAGRPEASCLVMSVMDSAEDDDGTIRSRRRIPDVVEAQRSVAQQSGCAFFDTHEATGGEGTMRRWYHSSPRLAASDYQHLTDAGARVLGALLSKALLKGYDEYLARATP